MGEEARLCHPDRLFLSFFFFQRVSVLVQLSCQSLCRHLPRAAAVTVNGTEARWWQKKKKKTWHCVIVLLPPFSVCSSKRKIAQKYLFGLKKMLQCASKLMWIRVFTSTLPFWNRVRIRLTDSSSSGSHWFAGFKPAWWRNEEMVLWFKLRFNLYASEFKTLEAHSCPFLQTPHKVLSLWIGKQTNSWFCLVTKLDAFSRLLAFLCATKMPKI